MHSNTLPPQEPRKTALNLATKYLSPFERRRLYLEMKMPLPSFPEEKKGAKKRRAVGAGVDERVQRIREHFVALSSVPPPREDRPPVASDEQR